MLTGGDEQELTAMLTGLFTAIAPPGSTDVWLVVGGAAFGVTVISALAAPLGAG